MALPYGAVNFEQLVRIIAKGAPIPVSAAPPKPKPGHVVPYAIVNGLGKIEVGYQFPTGAPVIVATEP